MSEALTPPSPPRTPWWKRKRAKLPTWAWIGIAVVAIPAIGSIGSPDDEDEAAPTTGTTPTEPQPVVSTADTAAPETTTTTTEVAETTTTEATTTTIAVNDADVTAILMLDAIGDGEITDAFVSDLEGGLLLDRVNVVDSALTNDGVAEIVIVGDSGYGTEEFQNEAAADVLVYFADLWSEQEWLCCGEKVHPRLNLTVDGRNWVIEQDVMLDVADRRMTPTAALGL